MHVKKFVYKIFVCYIYILNSKQANKKNFPIIKRNDK